MSNNQLYDYQADNYDMPPMFHPEAMRQHQRQQWAKVSGQAKTTGSWVANNPLQTLALGFAGLVAFYTVTGGEDTPAAPVPAAAVQEAGGASPLSSKP